MILREAAIWFFIAFLMFLWAIDSNTNSDALNISNAKVDSLKKEITLLHKKNDSLSLRLELKK